MVFYMLGLSLDGLLIYKRDSALKVALFQLLMLDLYRLWYEIRLSKRNEPSISYFSLMTLKAEIRGQVPLSSLH